MINISSDPRKSEGGKRVLVLEPSGNLWGSERALLDLCVGLKDTDWQVAICCPPSTPIIPKISISMATLFPCFTANLHLRSKAARLAAVLTLLRVIITFRPSLIYVNQAGATKVALIAATLARLQVVSHIRLLEDVQYINSLKSSKRLNHVICVSKFIYNAFSTSDSIGMQGHAIYDGYIPMRNNPLNKKIRNVAVCAGRIAKIKGQDILMLAAQKTKLIKPALRFHIVGRANKEDPYDQQLQQLQNELQLTDFVTFESFTPNIWQYLESADFLVCPSRIEPLGRVIFEAWDAGIVPIASQSSGGPAETIAAANAGVLYSGQDPDSLADAIIRTCELTLEEREKMIERGRRWMKDRLDPKVYAQQIAVVFNKAIGEVRKNSSTLV